eukprot:117136_1
MHIFPEFSELFLLFLLRNLQFYGLFNGIFYFFSTVCYGPSVGKYYHLSDDIFYGIFYATAVSIFHGKCYGTAFGIFCGLLLHDIFYGLLYATAVSLCHGKGYGTAVGIFHGQYSY